MTRSRVNTAEARTLVILCFAVAVLAYFNVGVAAEGSTFAIVSRVTARRVAGRWYHAANSPIALLLRRLDNSIAAHRDPQTFASVRVKAACLSARTIRRSAWQGRTASAWHGNTYAAPQWWAADLVRGNAMRGVEAVAFLGTVGSTVAAERGAAAYVDVSATGIVAAREAGQADRVAVTGLGVFDPAE
jgi:hypothetical protein